MFRASGKVMSAAPLVPSHSPTLPISASTNVLGSRDQSASDSPRLVTMKSAANAPTHVTRSIPARSASGRSPKKLANQSKDAEFSRARP